MTIPTEVETDVDAGALAKVLDSISTDARRRRGHERQHRRHVPRRAAQRPPREGHGRAHRGHRAPGRHRAPASARSPSGWPRRRRCSKPPTSKLAESRQRTTSADDLRRELPPSHEVIEGRERAVQAEQRLEDARILLDERADAVSHAEAAHADGEAECRRRAASLALPARRPELDEIDRTLGRVGGSCNDVVAHLKAAGRSHASWLETARLWREATAAEQTAEAEHRQALAEHEPMAMRLATLEDTIGIEFAELLETLARSTAELGTTEAALGRRPRVARTRVSAEQRAGGRGGAGRRRPRSSRAALCQRAAGAARCPGRVRAGRRGAGRSRTAGGGRRGHDRRWCHRLPRAADDDTSAEPSPFPPVSETPEGVKELADAVLAVVPAPDRDTTTAESVRLSLRARRDTLGVGWDAEDHQRSEAPAAAHRGDRSTRAHGPCRRPPQVAPAAAPPVHACSRAKQDQALRNLLQGLIAKRGGREAARRHELVDRMNERLEHGRARRTASASRCGGGARRPRSRPRPRPSTLLAKPPDLRTADESHELAVALSTPHRRRPPPRTRAALPPAHRRRARLPPLAPDDGAHPPAGRVRGAPHATHAAVRGREEDGVVPAAVRRGGRIVRRAGRERARRAAVRAARRRLRQGLRGQPRRAVRAAGRAGPRLHRHQRAALGHARHRARAGHHRGDPRRRPGCDRARALPAGTAIETERRRERRRAPSSGRAPTTSATTRRAGCSATSPATSGATTGRSWRCSPARSSPSSAPTTSSRRLAAAGCGARPGRGRRPAREPAALGQPHRVVVGRQPDEPRRLLQAPQPLPHHPRRPGGPRARRGRARPRSTRCATSRPAGCARSATRWRRWWRSTSATDRTRTAGRRGARACSIHTSCSPPRSRSSSWPSTSGRAATTSRPTSSASSPRCSSATWPTGSTRSSAWPCRIGHQLRGARAGRAHHRRAHQRGPGRSRRTGRARRRRRRDPDARLDRRRLGPPAWPGSCAAAARRRASSSSRGDAVAAIRTLTLNLTRLSRMGVGASSRRADFLRLATFFDDVSATDDDRHRLAAAAFGLYPSNHYGVVADDAGDPVPTATSWWIAPRAPVPISLRERRRHDQPRPAVADGGSIAAATSRAAAP